MDKIDKLIFNIDLPSGGVAPGTLLIAEPFLRESYFNHAVICMVDYSIDEPSMGLVMNKRINCSLADLVSDVERDDSIPVFCGGPMSGDRLFFLHALGSLIPHSEPIGNGLWVGGDFASMLEYVNAGYPIEGHVRFFLGYSGWSGGQLDDELRHHVWATAQSQSPAQLLSGSDDNYWHNQVRKLGSPYRGWLYHPQNPAMN